jgi:hypothetical protein
MLASAGRGLGCVVGGLGPVALPRRAWCPGELFVAQREASNSPASLCGPPARLSVTHASPRGPDARADAPEGRADGPHARADDSDARAYGPHARAYDPHARLSDPHARADASHA